MNADRVRRWPDDWVLETLKSAGLVDGAAEARVRASERPSAWQACEDAEVATASQIVEAVSLRFGLPVADMGTLEPEAAVTLSESVARRLEVVPLRAMERVLEVACWNPAGADLENQIAFATRKRVRLFVTDPATIDEALNALYPSADPVVDAVELDASDGILQELAAESGSIPPGASPTQVVDALIIWAARRGASDVHMEPRDDHFGVRFRIDGVLHEVARLPRALAAPMTSRMKVLAKLDIADRIRPHDGRTHVQVDGRQIDLRVSTLPVGTLGEKTVVRLLDQSVGVRTLTALGYDAEELRRIEYLINGHEGLVLVTGPTGSGKTTSLYAALRALQRPGINIVTVEDPVEYRLEGISQVQINERAGLTFSSALRSILRQDPDVVLVGEIRDAPTAEIAVQASLTGHMVLSTVHANDAPSTITRLLDIGVDRSGLANALKGVVAQRLLRRLCTSCRVPCEPADLADSQQRLLAHLDAPTLYRAGGCTECDGTGYRGRMVISEIALVTSAIERAIARDEDAEAIEEMCVAGGMRPFWESGLARVARGETSLNELLDTVYPPLEDGPAAAPAAPARPAASAQAPVPGQSAALGRSTVLGQSDVDAIFVAARTSTTGKTEAVGSREGAALSVLLVDDDGAARRALRAGLEREGFRVLEAANGRSGLEYVRRARPDIVVTELALPGLDGFALLRALREEGSRIPVTVLTANDDPSVTSWALELGATDVLIKPLDPRLLGRRLRGAASEAVA